jgi:hypothetical protein
MKNNNGQDIVIERIVKIIEIDPAADGEDATYTGLFANGNTYPFFIEELNDISVHGKNIYAEAVQKHYENEKDNS